MKAEPIPMSDIEEAAQGHTLYRAPGGEDHFADAIAQAAESRSDAGAPVPGDVGRIHERRRDIYEAMEHLEGAAARPSGHPDWAPSIDRALEELEGSLNRHIAETEAPDGFLEEISSGWPRLIPSVDALRKEHGQLLEACEKARESLTATTPDPALVRRQVTTILGRLMFHRQKGAELIYDAYNIDISVGD